MFNYITKSVPTDKHSTISSSGQRRAVMCNNTIIRTCTHTHTHTGAKRYPSQGSVVRLCAISQIYTRANTQALKSRQGYAVIGNYMITRALKYIYALND